MAARAKIKPLTYPRDAVVNIEHVAAAIGVSVRQVERLDLPTVYCGTRVRRYLWGQVLDELARRATTDATPPLRRAR